MSSCGGVAVGWARRGDEDERTNGKPQAVWEDIFLTGRHVLMIVDEQEVTSM
jgi:hypothetical protein